MIDPPLAETVVSEQSTNMEDLEAFVEDNINIQTNSPRHETGDAADSDPERLPTEEEWNDMRRYGSFISKYSVYKLLVKYYFFIPF